MDPAKRRRSSQGSVASKDKKTKMHGVFVDSSSDDDTVVADKPATNPAVPNTTTSERPPQSHNNVNFKQSSRPNFSKTFVPVNDPDSEAAIRGGELPAQDPIPGVPAGDSPRAFQADHSAPNLPAVAPPPTSITVRLLPGDEKAVYKQLAGRTLAVHFNDDFIVHSQEARCTRRPSADIRMKTTGSITDYLRDHGGVAQDILAEQVAKAQAKRIKPEDKEKIRQMIEEAERRLAMPPPQPSASAHSSKRRCSEAVVDNNPPIAKRVSFAETTSQSEPPQRQWKTFHEVIQMSDKGKAFQKKGGSMHKRVGSGLVPYNLAPLDPQDSNRASGAEIAQRISQHRATPISAGMTGATILYRQKNQDAYLKIVTGTTQDNRLLVTSEPPLARLARERAPMIAAAEAAFKAEQDEGNMIILPTVSASSRCRSKRSEMARVHIHEDEDVEMNMPQYDGSFDASDNEIYTDLAKLEDTVEDQESLIIMDMPFKPVGASTGDGTPRTAVFPPLPLADADGNLIKDEASVSDVSDDNNEMLDFFDTKDEDADAKGDSPDLEDDILGLEMDFKAAEKSRVKRQINLIIHDFDERNPPVASKRSTWAQEDLGKENEHNASLVARIEPSLKELTDLVVEGDWQDIKTLSELQKSVEKAFPLPAKPPAYREKVECGDCGRKGHKTENCKYQNKPMRGFVPAARISLPLPAGLPAREDEQSDGSKCINEKRLKDLRQANIDQKKRNLKARFAFGFDGGDDSPPEFEDHSMNNVPDKDHTIQRSGNNGVSLPKKSSNACSPPVKKSRNLSKPDDLPQPASDAALSLRGGESPVRKRAVDMSTPQSADLPKHLSEDADIEMADVTPPPFPSLEDNHQLESRETSVEYGDLLDQVDDQLDAQLRSEFEKSDDAKAEVELGSATGDEVVLAATALHAMSQNSIQVNVDSDGSAQQTSSQIVTASKMMQQTSLHSDVLMMAPPPPPSSRQSSKPPSTAGTPNPFRTCWGSPDPIDAAGLELLSGIRTTPASSSSKSVPFNSFRTPSAAATPMNVDSDEEDNEAIKFTPLSAKAKTAGATRVPAGAKARDGDDNQDDENIEGSEDDDSLPDSGAQEAKQKPSRKSKVVREDSDGEDELPFSLTRVKRNSSRKSLNTKRIEVPRTPNAKTPNSSTKPLKSSLKKTSRTTADSSLVANQGIIPAEDSETNKGRGKRATRQSTGASESRTEAPHSSRSARKGSDTSSRMKGAATSKHRADADDAEASEQDEEYSAYKSQKKGRGRPKAADSGDEDVVESVESGGRKSKSTQPTKKTARFKSVTPRAKSATAEPESETALCYNSKQIFLPVEIGDRVVRLFTKEDTKLYGKADEFDEFDGPWEVVDIRTRKKEKELVETVLEEGISEEMRKEAWKMLLTAKVKLGIPEEAEKKDKVEPWIQLSQVLPVLDADGIKEGKLGAVGTWIESLDSYKVLKKRLEKAKDTGGEANVIKKKTARSKGEDVESSLGVVNLRKNAFVAVVDKDPNWTHNGEFEVEKIRKKRLRLIWLGSASDEEKDQQDIDKWQEILKHKTGDALRHYVILVQWWVQWAGWPIESSTWEPRASFDDGESTMIVDHYNKHLDVFRDPPIEGVTYSLDHLFDHEDDYIDKCRSAMAKYQHERKFSPRLSKPRTQKVDNDPEKKAREVAAKKKLADMLFNYEADEQLAKVPKPRPQIDEKTSRSPGMSRGEKAIAEAAEKAAAEDDWENDLFGDHIESPAKSKTQNASVAPMAQMMQPGQELDIFGEENPSAPSQDREATYSPPPMSDERIAEGAEVFRTYNTPQKKKPEGFHPLYDVSPRAERKPKVISTSVATDDNAPQVKISNTPVKASASQVDRDGDVAMAEATHNESISNEAAATKPVVERAQTVEAVEELVVEERLFVQQDPIQQSTTVAQHSEMNAQMSLGPYGVLKSENTQEVLVQEQIEVTEGDVQQQESRY